MRTATNDLLVGVLESVTIPIIEKKLEGDKAKLAALDSAPAGAASTEAYWLSGEIFGLEYALDFLKETIAAARHSGG